MEAPVKKKRKHTLMVHHQSHEEGEGNWLVSYADMMTLLVGFFVILLSFSSVDQTKLEEAQLSVTKKFGGNFERPYGDIHDRIKKALEKENIAGAFAIKESSNGLEISFLGTVFFNLGSIDIKTTARDILDTIIPIIKSESKDFNILIEGHTDDIPVSAGGVYKNNWELSSLRACRVLDFFQQSAFAKEKLTAVGYGETRPEAPNHNQDGTANIENQSRNRRVVIKITKAEEPSLGK